ncbi:hypothetical protein [Magnetococcus marinus]|uniref:hypothetical protein n=1 Tax=Magnetococcus marinus TaxID=1124597 RepID=UPI00117CFFAA|nr:hypothetical protein [Magnetococcus marinus]
MSMLLWMGGCGPKQPPLLESESLRWQAFDHARNWQIRLRDAVAGAWQVEGVLRMENASEGRSSRVRITGHGQQSMRLQAYGPFRQLAMEVWLSALWLERVLPDRLEVERVPANGEGMAHFTGLEIPPQQLVRMLLGVTDLESSWTWQKVDGDFWLHSGASERIRVSPEDGRPLERWGLVRAGLPYHVRYQWRDQQRAPSSLTPDSIEVRVGESNRLSVSAKKWRLGGKLGPSSWRDAYPKTIFKEFWPLRRAP